MKYTTCVLGTVTLCLLGAPQIVDAQDGPRGEVAGGYQFMWDGDLEESFPTGWFVSAGANVTGRLAVIGEIAGSHKSTKETGSGADFESSFDLFTYLGGTRIAFAPATSAVRPFAQFLAGAANAQATIIVAGMTIDESQTRLAIQPGGGVDIRVTDSVAARAMVDYRRTFFEEADGNEIRVAAGIVVRF